jgi:hypothetical protein
MTPPKLTRSNKIWIHVSSGGGGTGANFSTKSYWLSARLPDEPWMALI